MDNPNLGKAIAPLATHFRPPHHSLSQPEREIAVCAIAGKWCAAYSSDAHAEILIGLGVSPDVVDALVYELASALADARWIPRSLYDRAVEVLGHDSITDATVLMGFYTSISLTLKFYDVPAGAPGIKR